MAVLAVNLMVAPPPLARAAVISSDAPAAWLTVRQQTRCEAMQDEYCRGRYGMTIARDGAFTVGPAPLGDRIQGKIGRDEQRRLRELIDRVASTLAGAGTSCGPAGVPGVRDQVEIAFGAGQTGLVYDLGGRVGMLCHAGDWHQVRALHEHLRRLLSRYYPTPFPNH